MKYYNERSILMKYKLINQPNKNFSAIQQILFNRGIRQQDIFHYLNLSDQDINSPLLLGEDSLHGGLTLIANAVKNNNKVLVIVDCDCDGFTAAALLINYLHKLFPSWVENKIDWFLHEGKQHGLSDCYKYAIENQYFLVICPDSSSNNYTYHAELAKVGTGILVLDHHLASKVSQNAVIINNQL